MSSTGFSRSTWVGLYASFCKIHHFKAIVYGSAYMLVYTITLFLKHKTKHITIVLALCLMSISNK